MAPPSAKIRAAGISILTATGLAGVKLATGLLTGSMAVLSSAIDSLLDILMSGVNFFAIRQAEQPADENHPFGHGKYETLATMVQSLVIAASGLWIIYESLVRLRRGVSLARIDSGIGVLVASTVVSVLISRYLRRVARATDSSALEADSLHFAMDVYTNLGAGGRAGDHPFRPDLLARPAAVDPDRLLHPLRSNAPGAPRPARRPRRGAAGGGPRGGRTPDRAHQHDITGYHNLRTRRAGSQKIMDFHLTVCKHLSVDEAHAIADHLEKRIEADIQGADVTIHIEPCREVHCPGRENCPVEQTRLDEHDDSAA